MGLGDNAGGTKARAQEAGRQMKTSVHDTVAL